jgi:hypothetical protein
MRGSAVAIIYVVAVAICAGHTGPAHGTPELYAVYYFIVARIL